MRFLYTLWSHVLIKIKQQMIHMLSLKAFKKNRWTFVIKKLNTFISSPNELSTITHWAPMINLIPKNANCSRVKWKLIVILYVMIFSFDYDCECECERKKKLHHIIAPHVWRNRVHQIWIIISFYISKYNSAVVLFIRFYDIR